MRCYPGVHASASHLLGRGPPGAGTQDVPCTSAACAHDGVPWLSLADRMPRLTWSDGIRETTAGHHAMGK